jgi:hypothetical protein
MKSTNDVIVIDDFLAENYHKQLLGEITSNFFPWYYQNSMSYSEDHPNMKDDFGNFGFNFWLNKNGNWTDTGITKFTMPLLFNIKDVIKSPTILRARLDMTIYNPNNYRHQTHVDFYEPHYSSIYYVNDSDGNTVIYNEIATSQEKIDDLKLTIKKVVEPKANRLLIFYGNYYHTGHSPSKHKNRIIINSNYGIA